ncbi:hypothetical protein [Alkalicoccus chagannorensis]|nr:hypothetical protein [Alkalicoccus chagannorensis]
MKNSRTKRKTKKRLVWKDLLKKKLGEVNGLPKKEPVSTKDTAS